MATWGYRLSTSPSLNQGQSVIILTSYPLRRSRARRQAGKAGRETQADRRGGGAPGS
jgi:hypothetical protein